MKRFFGLFAITAFLFSGCAKQEIEQVELEKHQDGKYVFTLKASMDSEITKTYYTGETSFNWSSGDQISVLFHKDATNKFFTLTTTGSGPTASFSGEIDEGYEIGASDDASKKIALFPAGAHTYTAGSLPVFNIPAETDFSATHFSANIPMSAMGDESNNFAFKHMAGAYKVVFTGISNTVSKVKLSVLNQLNYKVSGDFQLTTCYDAQHLYRWSEVYDSNEESRSISFVTNVVDGKATFYIPYSHATGTDKGHFSPAMVLTNPDNYYTLRTVTAKSQEAFISEFCTFLY